MYVIGQSTKESIYKEFQKARYKKKRDKRIRTLASIGHLASMAVLLINKHLAGRKKHISSDLIEIMSLLNAYEYTIFYQQLWNYYTGENTVDFKDNSGLSVLTRLAQAFAEGNHGCPKNRKVALTLYKTAVKRYHLEKPAEIRNQPCGSAYFRLSDLRHNCNRTPDDFMDEEEFEDETEPKNPAGFKM